MNAEPTNLTTVSDEDLALVERELERSPAPRSTHDLAGKLAFEKTAAERTQDVKKYDPDARYEVGDLIEKDYSEPLTVGSKSVEHFEGRVILKVVAKTHSPHFGCDMLEVDYPGGGVFRKYVEYMKKTRTQVLLPANCEGRDQTVEIMAKGDDPRLTELPMTERDLRTLEKNLRLRLAKDPNVFSWNDFWHLTAKKVEIPAEKVKEIEADFVATGQSAATEDLVRKFFGLEASSDIFDLTCLSLSALLEKKHRKEFILLSDAGWGKWLLKSILNALPENLAVAAPMAEVPELDELDKPEMSIVQDFPIKVYLTWREIVSGGIKIPRSLGKTLSHAREYAFTDSEGEGRTYTLYYYPNENFFLGLQDFYAQFNIPQGASLTMERTGPATFKFWVKKSKKKMSVIRLGYDAERDEFVDNGEEGYTFAEPNKIIYIERETLSRLLPLTATREGFDLRDFVVTIFSDPILATSARSLHFLRASHLIDLVRQTTQEDVEYVLVNSPEFTKSDKKKGVFTYHEPFVPEEEAAEGAYPEGYEEAAPEAYTPEEAALEAVAEELLGPETGTGFEEEPVAPQQVPQPPPEPGAAKKDKGFKKRKPKTEGDKGARPKKSERRVIEEKIVEEESVQEALAAVKEKKEDVSLEQRAAREKREKKEEFKPAPKKEEPKFGIFADLLKTALKKKPEEQEGEAPEEKAEEEPQDEAAAEKPEGEETK